MSKNRHLDLTPAGDRCPHCDGPVECFQGEPYCPDCTYYETLALAEQAEDEARRVRLALADAGRTDDEPHGAGPPF
jgi:hypothetical protein